MNKQLDNHIFKNIQSGFFIALLAMPLSLGIASASSFPPIAGLITAIVAGIVCSHLAGCKLSIKGPAAGLIVIVMATVNDLGQGDVLLGYKRALAIGVVAALCQILLALFKTAKFGKIMPPSVIHGMLAAIGVIIIAKQSHILLGNIPSGKTPFELLSEIPNSIMHANPELLFIGLITIFCMVLLPKNNNRIIKAIPPALAALLIVVPLSIVWHLHDAHSYTLFGYDFNVGPEFLINIPHSLLDSLVWPDFSILQQAIAYKYVAMLALVGSLESVLTVIAVDSITQTKKESDLNKDLLAIGVGNLISSLLGGLPMISEVVRSKANIDSKATNKWSAFFHGLFLLIAVVFFGDLLREIPLSALAAMLIMVGFKLAAPSQIKHAKSIGIDQLLMFCTTLFVTLAEDLLIGVIAGLLVKVIFHLSRGINIKDFFILKSKITHTDEQTIIEVTRALVFSNSLQLQNLLNKELNNSKKVILDVSQVNIIDHTTMTCLQNFLSKFTNEKLQILGLIKLKPVSNHCLATHKTA